MSSLYRPTPTHPGRKSLDIRVIEETEIDNLPESLGDFISFFRDALEATPPEHRESVRVSCENGYDGEPSKLSASYKRPETDAEWSERLERSRVAIEKFALEQEKAERMAFLALKKKYEGS